MITTVFDSPRGCGTRKKGGMYLMSGDSFEECGKLPIPLTVCPCCNAGIKPSRGWTWVTGQLIQDAECFQDGFPRKKECDKCYPLGNPDPAEKFGLIWIGELYYKTPTDFMREGVAQGISRRLTMIPKDLVIGETWVLLAHRKTIYDPSHEYADEKTGFVPGIFSVFRPDRIEYVVKGDETEEEIEKLEKRGLTLVDVKMTEEQMEIESGGSDSG